VRQANPFLLSIGIHLTLIALLFGAMNVVRKTIPVTQEKIRIKILQSLEPTITHTVIQPPLPIPKKSEPIIPKPVQSLPSPKKPLIPENKPMTEEPQMDHPAPPTPTAIPKIANVVPTVAQPKTPPPVQIEERYEEDNLGRIRTILIKRLKYPKNALRLHQQGEITITFNLGIDKEISQISITQSSGFELLDDAAIKLIEASAYEFPTPTKSVRISVPISYKLQ
jgi:periplasmic protein TonB